jgi:hypothetical protein
MIFNLKINIIFFWFFEVFMEMFLIMILSWLRSKYAAFMTKCDKLSQFKIENNFLLFLKVFYVFKSDGLKIKKTEDNRIRLFQKFNYLNQSLVIFTIF